MVLKPVRYGFKSIPIWCYDHSNMPDSDPGTCGLWAHHASAAIHMHEALTPERLDGSNYVEWSLNAQNKIRDRKCWGYITGKKATPKDQKSDEYEALEDENCLVKSWLLDSMTKETRSLFIRLATAKEIWETVKETYSVN
ncbi:hypothetical protein A2U01_0002087, partial [Trifolium medium]|nr:hypothetical protein [Trifolium medium]